MNDPIVNRFSVSEAQPLVGWKVRAYDIPGYDEYAGTEVTITSVGATSAGAEFPSQQKPDDTMYLRFREYEIVDTHTLTVSEVRPSEETGTITDLQAEVTRLKAEIERLEGVATRREETIARLNTEVRNWSHDWDRYTGRIVEEAVNRDWCEQYEQVMDDIRPGLLIAVIPDREQEFEIEVEITGEASTTRSVFITARSLEDAEELFNNDPSDYIDVEEALTESVRYNGWDSTEANVQ